MPKFLIELEKTIKASVAVEAKDEKEAGNIALNLSDSLPAQIIDTGYNLYESKQISDDDYAEFVSDFG